MKNTYNAPKASIILLQAEEAILSVSKTYDVVSGKDQLSNHQGWNSESWTEAIEEDED